MRPPKRSFLAKKYLDRKVYYSTILIVLTKIEINALVLLSSRYHNHFKESLSVKKIQRKKTSKAFGYELVLDLYNCRTGACDDVRLCYKFLNDIVAFLGMHKQAPADVIVTNAKKYPDKAGLSGWVPLVESSVVIHTLSVKDYISVDVYCCKPFSTKGVKAFVKKYYGPKKMELQYVVRGKNYYR